MCFKNKSIIDPNGNYCQIDLIINIKRHYKIEKCDRNSIFLKSLLPMNFNLD